MAAPSRQQPAWEKPEGENIHGLKIYNSLTRSKQPFHPIDPEGKKVTWYSCGPTVYDDAHLGHARNYVTTDILRRIMRDYFKFDLKFVQNITDVDDKIILRGRQQHLFSKFKKQNPTLDQALQPASDAFHAYARKNTPKLATDLSPSSYPMAAEQAYGGVLRGESLDGSEPPGDKEAKIKMHLRTLSTAADALVGAANHTIEVEEFYAKVEDVLFPYLDALYGTSIDPKDHGIFNSWAKKFEIRFNEDMKALNCAKPDVVTRVTEYCPEIVTFVEKIVQNQFAYRTSDNSVYFDINAFEADGNHYARLEPWNRNDKDLQADGDGALTAKTSEKRSEADFVLWKSSKPGEPSWPSPWGGGRPGWHIECSAMASDQFGNKFDIHSGGIDLAFPHHDNELAQSEAFWVDKGSGHSHQWVNYFIHMGHLNISGSKMSKSLKNFTTIRDALARGEWTPRSLRIVFLLGGWRAGIEVTDDLVTAGLGWEDKVNNFFLKVKSIDESRSLAANASNGASKTGSGDDELLLAQREAERQVREALCDSFSTPEAMRAISDLITKYNSTPRSAYTDETAIVLASWVTELVRIFGLDDSATPKPIGWAGLDIPDIAKPFVYPASKLRDQIRQRAKKGDLPQKEVIGLSKEFEVPPNQPTEVRPYSKTLSEFQADVRSLAESDAGAKDYLKLCDQLRDVRLWDLGIYLEDSVEEGQPAMVRPLDKELIRARGERETREQEKQAAKAQREQEASRKAEEQAEKGKLNPADMFRTGEFSEWDVDGVPTKDANGEELAKNRVKKLRKQWEVQKRAHDAWKAGAAS